MVIFDRSRYDIDIKNTIKWLALVELIFDIYNDCGSVLLTSSEEEEYHAMSRIYKDGLPVNAKSKIAIINEIYAIDKKGMSKAYIYYMGSAYTRSINEMPLLSKQFLLSISDRNDLKTQAQDIIDIIEKRKKLGGLEMLCGHEIQLKNEDLLPVMKLVNEVTPITNLLYLASSEVVQFVSYGHLFTLTTKRISDGRYYKLDLDDGFYYSQKVFEEYSKAFKNWVIGENIFKSNIIY